MPTPEAMVDAERRDLELAARDAAAEWAQALRRGDWGPDAQLFAVTLDARDRQGHDRVDWLQTYCDRFEIQDPAGIDPRAKAWRIQQLAAMDAAQINAEGQRRLDLHRRASEHRRDAATRDRADQAAAMTADEQAWEADVDADRRAVSAELRRAAQRECGLTEAQILFSEDQARRVAEQFGGIPEEYGPHAMGGLPAGVLEPTGDHQWFLEALRGETWTEPALHHVGLVRAQLRAGYELPADLAAALAEGDRSHPGDPRRYIDVPIGPSPVDVDPATTEAYQRRNGDTSEPATAGPRPSLVIEDLAAIAARVRAAPDPGWLARPIWPADAHGVIGAEDKAGKTWLLLDLAVAKASGGAWLGRWPVDHAGPVLLFLGEGGERKMLRRLWAVGEFYGLTPAEVDQLPLRMCHRAPQLTALEHRAIIAAELDAHPPALVGLDPLYLAARGANGASLYEMGAHLEDLQATTQRHGAALVVVTHWNQTGSGKGRSRFTGAGPAEWGRVTMSIAVDEKRSDGPKSIVTLRAEFVGDEIADSEARFVRTVWVDDPDDLRSPMHYQAGDAATRADVGDWHGPTECMAAVEQFFIERPGVELAKTKVRDQLRALNLSYRNTTVDESLERLALAGRLAVRSGSRNARYFRLPDPPKADDVLTF